MLTKVKELKKDTSSVREWRALESKLRVFYRATAVQLLAKDRGYGKNISHSILIELQRERFHLEVIEQSIPRVIHEDLTEAQTKNLRKQLAKSYKRGKRLERATAYIAEWTVL